MTPRSTIALFVAPLFAMPAAGGSAQGAPPKPAPCAPAPLAPTRPLPQPCDGTVASPTGLARPSSVACVPVPTINDRCHRWTASHNGSGTSSDGALAVAPSADGSAVYVTGYHWSGDEYDYGTLAYDAVTGAERWFATYDGEGGSRDVAEGVAVSPSGTRVYVTGWSYGPGSYNYATIAYDASTGLPVWTDVYDAPGNDIDAAYDLAVSPDGSRVYVTGESHGGDSGYDFATVAYDADTGERLWIARLTGDRNYQDTAYVVSVAPDGGRVYVTGRRGPETNYDYLTVAYEAADQELSGEQLWVATYSAGGNRTDIAHALAVSPDGSSVYVAGESERSDTGADYATVAYDAATGGQRWVARVDGDAYGDVATDVGVAPDGGTVFVTGSSLLVEDQFALVFDTDYLTLAYDAATGAERWSARYDGPAGDSDGAAALTVAPGGGSVYVTGTSIGVPTRGAFGLGYDVATLGYHPATGAPQWVARYDSGDSDFGVDVAAAGNSVFVTGTSFSSLTSYDYATEAYEA